MFKNRLLTLVIGLPLLGCASSASTDTENTPTSFYDYQLYTPRAKPISLAQFTQLTASADVILIGEWHAHTGIHRFQSDFLRQTYINNPTVALSMEQFSRDKQAVVDQYLAAEIGEQPLIDQGNAWQNYQSDYRPLIEYSKSNHIDVIAANAPRKIIRCIARQGSSYLETLPPLQRAWVAKDIHTQSSPYKTRFMASMHHGEAEQTEKQFVAQVTWDETMAESIVSYLTTHPEHQVIHIAGKFHVQDGLGIKASILRRAPNLNVIVVTPKSELNSSGSDYQLHVLPPPVQYVTQENRIKAYQSLIHQSSAVECE